MSGGKLAGNLTALLLCLIGCLTGCAKAQNDPRPAFTAAFDVQPSQDGHSVTLVAPAFSRSVPPDASVQYETS
jgi:hypothetical protein